MDTVPLWWVGQKYHKNSKVQQHLASRIIQKYPFRGDEHILDVGCGDGKNSAKLLQKVPKGSVIGIDPCESMITFAKETYERPSLQFELGSASTLSFSSQFDLITAFSSLHWESRQKEAILCFRKALRPKGKLIFVIPNLPIELMDSVAQVYLSPQWRSFFVNFKSPAHILNTNEYALLLIEAGFLIERLEMTERSYSMPSFKKYRGMLDAILPHFSCLPPPLKDPFLDQILALIDQKAQKDAKGNISFKLDAIEVMAEAME